MSETGGTHLQHEDQGRVGSLRRLGRAVAGWPGAVAIGVVVLAAAGIVASGAIDRVSIVAGGFVDAIALVAAAGLVVGVVRRPGRWWLTWGLGIAVVAAALVAVAHWYARSSGLVTEHYPATFVLWAWLGLVAVGVAVTGWWSGGAAMRVARVLTAPVALLSGFLLVNQHYGYWPTVNVLLSRPATGQVSADSLAREIEQHRLAARDPRLAHLEVPTIGQYGPIHIADSPVGFAARSSWVWLPPAWFRTPGIQLPVLYMLPGWPGNVQDWVKAGQVLDVANNWAAAHHGVAPVMVFVDENGAYGSDTECVNGSRGQAASYLAQDVPEWVQHTLGIRPNRRTWGLVGFSEGGTCAIGLGAEYPRLFGTLVDMAGDGVPNHGNAAQTLQYLYGGNEAADLTYQFTLRLADYRYPHTVAWFAAGTADVHGLRVSHRIAVLAAKAGMRTHFYVGSGGHTWTFARAAFAHIYPALVSGLDRAESSRPARSGCDACTIVDGTGRRAPRRL